MDVERSFNCQTFSNFIFIIEKVCIKNRSWYGTACIAIIRRNFYCIQRPKLGRINFNYRHRGLCCLRYLLDRLEIIFLLKILKRNGLRFRCGFRIRLGEAFGLTGLGLGLGTGFGLTTGSTLCGVGGRG